MLSAIGDCSSSPSVHARRRLLTAPTGGPRRGIWVQTDNAYVTGNLVPVTAQATGIITQVLFEETQFVNRGDVMIRLDEHEAYAALGRPGAGWVKPFAVSTRCS